MTVLGCIWDTPPANFTLSNNEIHIWCAYLDLAKPRIEELAQILSADELLKAQRFRFDEHRNRFIVRRGILRMLLGSYVNMEPQELQFNYGSRGKPALKETCGGDKLRFNLSDSNCVALYAVTRDRDLGIDIEHIRDMQEAEQLVKRFFSEREYAAFTALDRTQQQAAFFACWARKEAYIKAIGEGLYLPLDRFDVSVSPDEPAKLLSINGNSQLAEKWLLQDLRPAPGYAAALAVEGLNFNINCWQLNPEIFL